MLGEKSIPTFDTVEEKGQSHMKTLNDMMRGNQYAVVSTLGHDKAHAYCTLMNLEIGVT